MTRHVLALGAAMVTCALAPAAHAQDLQIEANLLDGQGVTAGLRVGDALALLVGVRGFVIDDRGMDVGVSYWEVPVEAKVYLSAPSAGALAPVIVTGVSYGRQRNEDEVSDGLGLRALIGGDYFLTDAFAIHASTGFGRTQVWGAADVTMWGVVARLGVVIRP